MSGNGWVEAMPPFHTVDAAAVTASATLTELTHVAATGGQLTTAASVHGSFEGKRFEFQAWGHYTTTATQGTITIGLYSGTIGQAIGSAAAIAVTPATAWVASQTGRHWRIEGSVSIRTLGSAGAAVGIIECTNIAAAGVLGATATGATVAIDTTVARYWALGATISVASQSITCRYAGLRAVN